MKQRWAALFTVGLLACQGSSSTPPATRPAASAALPTTSGTTDLKLSGAAKVVNSEIQIPGKIHFVDEKATIKHEDKVTTQVLDTLLAVLKDNPSITKLRVEGHTDDNASAKLAQERAEAIVKWLLARGIDPGRLLMVGLGAAKPLVDNDSDEHREQNRRIEFKIWERDGKPTPASQVPDPPPPAPTPPKK